MAENFTKQLAGRFLEHWLSTYEEAHSASEERTQLWHLKNFLYRIPAYSKIKVT